MTVSTLTKEQAAWLKGTAEKHVDLIIAYENNELDTLNTIKLFCYLQRTRMAYQLQGHYGRMAQVLIAQGFFNEMGEPDLDAIEFALSE